MMGFGTVLALARANGHRAIGVDVDPLAVVIATVWTTSIDRVGVRRQGGNEELARATGIFRSSQAF